MGKVLFYASGSELLGYGHLYRVLGILRDLSQALHFSVLVTNELQENFYTKHGVTITRQVPRKLDLIVIDSKEDDLPFCINSILNVTNALFLAVDTFSYWSFKADFLISPTFYSDQIPKFKEHKNFLGGRDFVSIRPGNDIPMQARNILVTFGGSDPNNITELVLKSITDLDLLQDTNVILGPSYCGSILFLQNCFPQVNFYSNVDATIEFVRNANIVVTALGTTVNEIELTGKYGFLIFNYEEDKLNFTHLRSGSLQKEKWFNFGVFDQFEQQKFKKDMQKYRCRKHHYTIEALPISNRIAQFINLNF